MNRTAPRRRGPRYVREEEISFANESVVLQNRLYGRVLAVIRISLDASQQTLAQKMYAPASTVSKLEQGLIVVAVHHLDVAAAAFNELGRETLLADPNWQGWEFHRLTEDIGAALEREGYTVMWAAPGDLDEIDLVPERKLNALVKAHWPETMRRRIGW